MLGERKQKHQRENDHQQDLEKKNNEDKSDNSIIWTIRTSISYYTKYKSSLGYKAVYNHIILYLISLMMTDPKILEDPENEQINVWY